MCPTSERVRHFRVVTAALTTAGLFGCAAAFAQEDLSRPPRLSEDETTADEPSVDELSAQQSTGEPRTEPAAAAAQTDAAQLEEIVVVSDQNPWRLPDLGSSWRGQDDGPDDDGRISVELVPLWNPDAEEIPTDNPFSVGDDFGRVGFIEVFRVRFGRR